MRQFEQNDPMAKHYHMRISSLNLDDQHWDRMKTATQRHIHMLNVFDKQIKLKCHVRIFTPCPFWTVGILQSKAKKTKQGGMFLWKFWSKFCKEPREKMLWIDVYKGDTLADVLGCRVALELSMRTCTMWIMFLYANVTLSAAWHTYWHGVQLTSNRMVVRWR